MSFKVLIVDDSPVLRATARRAVVQAGVDDEGIREAGNGREALQLLAAEQIDLVLLDVHMPVMDGFEFVERKAVDATLADVEVVLVTSEGNRLRLERMAELGVTRCLHKPFEPEALRALVQELVVGGRRGRG